MFYCRVQTKILMNMQIRWKLISEKVIFKKSSLFPKLFFNFSYICHFFPKSWKLITQEQRSMAKEWLCVMNVSILALSVSRHNRISVMIRILASIPDKGGVISGGEENFHFLKSPDLLWGPPSLLFSAHRRVFFCR